MKSSIAFIFVAATILLLPKLVFAKISESFKSNNSSLFYIENKGQIVDQYGKQRNDIDLKLETPGMNIFICKGQLHYQWNKIVNSEQGTNNSLQSAVNSSQFSNHKSQIVDQQIEAYRLDVTLVGANKNADLVTEEAQDYFETYYLPQCPDGATARSYKKITYKNIYPNIDWVLYTKNSEIKYDFVVHEGGNVNDIKLRYDGATSVNLSSLTGDLGVTTPFGSITEQAPYTYNANTKQEIASAFVLNNNVLSFYISPLQGDLDWRKNNQGQSGVNHFIIDPTVKWATYFGGSNNQFNRSITADASGNAYIAGTTTSSNNIATSGTYQTSFTSPSSDFIAKFNSAGNRIWGSYYAGINGGITIDGIAADNFGGLYFAGTTNNNSGVTTSGSHQPNYGGGTYDGCLVKFDTGGHRLWATYYGGSSYDDIWGLTCDNAGNVYICGQDSSTNNIASTGAYQTTPSYGFLAKFNGSGIRLWGTYVNGIAESVIINGVNMYVCGSTYETTGVATTGAYQTALAGSGDGYVMAFTTNCQKLWGTYYGGNSADACGFITLSKNGNVVAVGTTFSNSGIASSGAYQTSYMGSAQNNFIVTFNNAGVRQWATYYDYGPATTLTVTCGLGGELLILSSTQQSGMATTGAYQTSYGGGLYDAMFTTFNINGQRTYCTYLGGNQTDFGIDIARTKNRIYLACNLGSYGSATSGAYQTSTGGPAFLLALELSDTLVYIQQPYTDTALCGGDSLHLTYDVTHRFTSSNVFSVQLSNASGSFASPSNIATVNGDTLGSIAWQVPTNLASGTGYRLRVVASSPIDTSYDVGIDIKIGQHPASLNATSNSPVCTGGNLSVNGTTTTSNVSWSWSGPNSFAATSQTAFVTNVTTAAAGDYIVVATNNGCISKDTVTVVVNQTPATPTAGSNSPVCVGGILNLTASGSLPGAVYHWSGPSYTSTLQNPAIVNIQTSGAGTYAVYVSNANCNSGTASTNVVVNSGPSVSVYANPGSTICTGASVALVAVPFNIGTNPATYQWYLNSNAISGATNVSYIAAAPNGGDGFYVMMTAGTACNTPISSNTVSITTLPATPPPAATIAANPGTDVWPYLNVSFSISNLTNGGSAPTYQWKLNGQNIAGATASKWNTTTLKDGDSVCLLVTSSDACATPKSTLSNCLKMKVPTGLSPLQGDLGVKLAIYPNPNRGEFYLTTHPYAPLKRGSLNISDIQGRTITNYIISEAKTLIQLPSATSAGVYVGKYIDGEGNMSVVRIVVEE